VTVGDVNAHRLRLARDLGAAIVDLRDNGYPGDADLAIDTSGTSAGRRALLDALGRRGVLVCVGHGQDLGLDVSADLIGPERAVLGSEYFRFDALPANLALLRDHRAELAPIITHRIPAGRTDEAIRTFLSGETGKIVIER
jgi:threonine dehydrogenase-like Zn-dependent dehydrogenase